MTRVRPSGLATHQRRFVKGEKVGEDLKIPVVKDLGVFIYVTETGEWPKSPLITLLTDPGFKEQDVWVLEELRPGEGMGQKISVLILEIERRILLHPGKYGQVKVLVLAQPVPSNEEMGEMSPAGLRTLAKTRKGKGG